MRKVRANPLKRDEERKLDAHRKRLLRENETEEEKMKRRMGVKKRKEERGREAKERKREEERQKYQAERALILRARERRKIAEEWRLRMEREDAENQEGPSTSMGEDSRSHQHGSEYGSDYYDSDEAEYRKDKWIFVKDF